MMKELEGIRKNIVLKKGNEKGYTKQKKIRKKRFHENLKNFMKFKTTIKISILKNKSKK